MARITGTAAGSGQATVQPEAPTPDALPGPPRRSMKYYGSKGELIPYDQWKREQMEAWAVRENDPKIIDNIAITETIAPAQARFAGVVGDYRWFGLRQTQTATNSSSGWNSWQPWLRGKWAMPGARTNGILSGLNAPVSKRWRWPWPNW